MSRVKSGTIILTLVILSVCLVRETSSIYCLECSDVPSASDCNTVKECGQHEVCFSSSIVATTGHIFRKMGCRDTKQCTSGISTGKRDSDDVIDGVVIEEHVFVSDGNQNDDPTDIIVCDGCCNSTWCQTDLCQDQGLSQDRGPICLKCDQQTPGENCTKIQQCGRDEVCFEGLKMSPASHLLRQAGCFSALSCQRIGLLTGAEFCWNCCHDDLCNVDCDAHNTTATTGSPAPCQDITPAATCQLAASLVCNSEEKARNANCLHFCGFC